MIDCSICNTGFPTEKYVVVNACFERLSKVRKEILTPLQLNCHHIFHYSCISHNLHEQTADKSNLLSCPTCHTIIDFGKDNAPWGVYFNSNFEAKIYLKKEDIFKSNGEKVNSFFVDRDLFVDVKGTFEVVD